MDRVRLLRGLVATAMILGVVLTTEAAPLSSFRSVSRLEVPSDVSIRIASTDPVFSRQTMVFSRPLDSDERAGFERPLRETGLTRSRHWRDDRTLEVEWRTALARIDSVPMDDGRHAWIAGTIRETGFLPAFFLGDRCSALLARQSSPAFATVAQDVCTSGEVDPPRNVHLSIDEELLSDVLRMQSRADWRPTPAGFERWLSTTRASSNARRVVLVQLAMTQIAAGDDPGALKTLDRALFERRRIPPSLARTIERLRRGAFERLVESAVATETAPSVLDIYMEHNDELETDTLDDATKLQLARTFEAEEQPGHAVRQYLDLIDRRRLEERTLLKPLTRAYLANGDDFRAYATASYARERWPRQDDEYFTRVLERGQ